MTNDEYSDMILERSLKDVVDKLDECMAHSDGGDYQVIFAARNDLMQVYRSAIVRVQIGLDREKQEKVGKISDLPSSSILSDGDSFFDGGARKAVPLQRAVLIPQDNAEAFAAAVDYADGWRPWSGGECPHDGMVFIRTRNGDGGSFARTANNCRWNHLPESDPISRKWDIVAWKPA